MAAYVAVHKHPSDFPPAHIDYFAHGNRIVVAGHADATGVTAPGYSYRRIYKLTQPGERDIPGLFVYEAGEFVPVSDWYAAILSA